MKKPLSFGATMLASALGVVIVSVLSGLLMLIMTVSMVLSIGRMSDTEVTLVKPNSFLSVDLGKISGDRTADKLMQTFGEGRTVGLIDATRAIREAASDGKVTGLWLKDPGMASLSWASLEELRAAIEEFRQSGKPVVSYATSYSQGGYYVASASDVVSLHPAGMVELRGIGAEVMYYKDMLDKLGVEMQLIRPESCAYKSAGEVYTLNKMSEANREQIRAYVGSIWKQASKEMAASRGMALDDLNRIVDNLDGYLAEDACAHRVVDTLCFEEDVRMLLKEQYACKHLVPIEKYVDNMVATPSMEKDYIAVIYAEGNVVDGRSRGMNTAVYGDDIVAALKQAAADEKVKAIVLRVNSPGGQATASESMTHAVMAAKQKKPVVVSMGDLAASAGYEMSCMADVIVAQPMTITGSIGVFGTIPNVGRLMHQKLGVATDTVSTNRNANGLAIYRPLSPTAKAMMTRNVEDFYKTFVGRVAEGRHMTYEAVHAVARGRVWTGADAKQVGLVDTLGGFDLALRIAAEKAGLEKWSTRAYPKEKDVWTRLSEMLDKGEEGDLDLLAKVRLGWMYRYAQKKGGWHALSAMEQDLMYVVEAEGVQARLPFVVASY